MRTEEFAPLLPGETIRLDDGSTADVWAELVTVTDAEVVARFLDGPLPGTPALTRRPVGDGVAWYLATWLDEVATTALADRLTREASVTRLGPGRDVEVVRRERYLFVLNRGTTPAVVPARGVDLLSDALVTGAVTVAAGCAAVVREAP